MAILSDFRQLKQKKRGEKTESKNKLKIVVAISFEMVFTLGMRNNFIPYSVTLPAKTVEDLKATARDSGVKVPELIRAATHHMLAGKPSQTTVIGMVATFRKAHNQEEQTK